MRSAASSRPTIQQPSSLQRCERRRQAAARSPSGGARRRPAAALATVGVTCTARWRRQHDAGGTGALGGAQERAEVAGIGDAVDGHEERRRAARRRAGEVVELGLGQRAAFASTPWGASLRACGVELPAAHLRIGTRSVGGQVDDVGRPRRCPPDRWPPTSRGPCGGRRAAARARPGDLRPARRRDPARRVRRSAPARRRAAARAGRPARPAGARAPGAATARSGPASRACGRGSSRLRHHAPRPSRRCPRRRPRAPRPSARRPFTLTGAPTASDRRVLHLAAARRQLRALAHHLAVDVPGRPTGRRAASRPPRAAARASRRPPSAASVSGKCWPMSPRPAAPSRASATAWADTSASLWPARPRSPANAHPAEHEPARSGRRVKRWTSKPWPDPHGDHRRSPATRCAGPREVVGHGDLAVVRLAGDDDHPAARRLDERGVVGALAAAGVGRGAGRRRGTPAASAPRRGSARSGVATTTPSASTTLIVSATATAGHGAVGARAHRGDDRARTGRPPAKGRARVVHDDRRRRRRAPRPDRRAPTRCAVAPPATRRPGSSVATGRHDHDDAVASRPAAAATAQSSDALGRREGSNCFAPPKRVPAPGGHHDRPHRRQARSGETVVPSAPPWPTRICSAATAFFADVSREQLAELEPPRSPSGMLRPRRRPVRRGRPARASCSSSCAGRIAIASRRRSTAARASSR